MKTAAPYRAKCINYPWLWHLGYFLKNGNDVKIMLEKCFGYSVNGQTLCKHTSFFDKKGQPIYTGDIVAFKNTHVHVVCEKYGAFGYEPHGWDDFITYAQQVHTFGITTDNRLMELEIIGNKYDHPHLLPHHDS